MCWECFKKTEKGQRVSKGLETKKWEREMLPYKHPWCDKTFLIERQWWNMEAEPQMCCIECCGDPNNCDIATKNWI